jgi:hypothetical protein
MKKNILYILIFLVFFILVAIMYIGGLREDTRRDKEQEMVQKGKNSHKSEISLTTSSEESSSDQTIITNTESSIVPLPPVKEPSEETASDNSSNGHAKQTQENNGHIPNSAPHQENTKSDLTKPDIAPKEYGSGIKENNKKLIDETSSNKTPHIGSLKSSATASSAAASEQENTTTGNDSIIPDKDEAEQAENTVEEQNSIDQTDETDEQDQEDQTELKENTTEDSEKNLTEETQPDDSDLEEVPEEETPDETEPEEEPEEQELTNLEKAQQLAEEGGLEAFLEITDMVENCDNTLEQRQLIQIAGTMSDSLSPEILFEVLKVATSTDMLKMAVVTLSGSTSSEVIELAVANYNDSDDSVEKDYLLDVIVQSDSPEMVETLSSTADSYSYSSSIGTAAVNTMAIIGTEESTTDLLNRFSSVENEADTEALTSAVSKIYTEEALSVLIDTVESTENTQEMIAIIQALGNYSAKEVSSTLDDLYNQSDIDQSIKYEIDKTYEKISN